MTPQETTILLDYLFKHYPAYRADKEALIESFYRTYSRFDRNGVKYICDKYLELKKPFFPRISELEEIRIMEIQRAEYIINDPRNPFYLGEAGERRQKRINEAKQIIKGLRPITLKELNR